MFSKLPLSVLSTVVLVLSTSAAASLPAAGPGLHIPLKRRTIGKTPEEWAKWAQSHRENLGVKYGGTPSGSSNGRRATGTNFLTNAFHDSSYFGSLAIGTPPVAYDVILDTGSADLWVAGNNCISQGCASVATFNPASSSTFVNESASFMITYGSGQAAGVLGRDVVQMAGFSVSNQVFAVCDRVTSNLLTNPVSGLMGLAFESIASSNSPPFWQTLVSSGAWDQPLMAFQLSRFINSTADDLEPGGSFTMGSTNTSLYTGNIDFINIPDGEETYWILPLKSVTVQGSLLTLPDDDDSFAAIDTGTTLVGGPASAISSIFSQIPGAAAATGNFEGYYTYPCDTDVNVSLNFGGQSWSISPADFRLTRLSPETCVGAFFELQTGSSAPSWIIGDTFLKNVYSVFRYNPPSVGFAQLSDVALAANGQNGPIATPTIGSVAATVSATGSIRVMTLRGWWRRLCGR